MRVLRSITPLLILTVVSFADTKVVPITDISGADSPVRNHGTVTLAQETSAGSTLVSSSQDWTAKNISRKPIVAVIESLVITYEDGQKSGGVQRYEQFFYTDLMKPGDELSFSEPAKTVGQYRNREASSIQTKCEATVLWVQFADGSTFGDRFYGDSLLSDRRATLKGLYLLRDAYRQQGGEHFLEEIGKSSGLTSGNGYLNMYVEQLRDHYSQTKDIQGTYNKLQAWIEIAEARRQLLE